MILEPRPTLAVNDSGYAALGDPEPLCECLLGDSACRVEAPYLDHLMPLERGEIVCFPAEYRRSRPAIFGDHIVDIVLLGTDEKMIGTEAGRDVAMMVNLQPGRDGPVMQNPGSPMGQHGAAMGEVELAVSGGHPVPIVEPASAIGVVLDLGQQLLKQGKAMISHLGAPCRGQVRGSRRFNGAALALAIITFVCASPPVSSAQQTAKVVATCGSASYSAGATNYVTLDTTGKVCDSAGGGGGGGVTGVTTTQTAGTVTTHLTFQSAAASNSSRKGCTLQNTSADIEYVFFGATVSASTAASFQLAGGQSITCAVGGTQVATDNIAIASKVTDGATYAVAVQ